MRCPNCGTINPPNAKFCLECGNRLVVCPVCGTVNLPIAKFCIECGTPLQTQESTTTPLSPSNPENTITPIPTVGTQSVPRNGRAQPNAGTQFITPAAPEERRIVTIMFADITGYTPLADRFDPEDMRAILVAYFNLMTEQIRRHGGTVEKYIGDAVMAVFGAPIAHEDDPARAIRAALDMQTALTNFNRQRQAQDPEATRLQMRIGINTGEVATPSTQFNRLDFLITGDAVNVAARLQQVAAPDTILVGERTYLATRESFDFSPIAPLQLKGKSEPTPAWVVHGYLKRSPIIQQHPRGIKGLEAHFIGRTLELTLMHATYARVQAERHPHLITLLGVPGIGKSRLVHEFIAREQEAAKSASSTKQLPGPRVLQGRCPPYGEGLTYWPLAEVLRSLLGVQDSENPDDLQLRFNKFVRETLASVKRDDEAEQVSSAILRSVGRWLRGSSSTNVEAGLTFDRAPILSESVEAELTSALVPTSASGRQTRSTHVGAGSTSTLSEQSGPQVTLMRSWRLLLEAIAQQQPLILIIDDLQWADDALLDLLEYLTERMTDVPVLFLCPARPDFFERRRDWGGGRRNFTTIALDSLSPEETRELVNSLLTTTDLPEVLYQTIQTRAEGNPFFVEEIVRMLIDQGVLVSEKGYWHLRMRNETLLSELANPAALPGDTLIDQHYILPLPRIPDTIQGVLAARIDLLNPIEKQVIQHAAIIGRTFWLSCLLDLASNLDTPNVLATIDALIQHEFIGESEKQGRSPVENDRIFSFKHVLTRDVVYNNIPRVRRSQEHARVALWIEQHAAGHLELFAELLAYHYQQALANWSSPLLPHLNLPGADGTRDGETDTSAHSVQLARPELRQRTITYLSMAGDQALHSYYTIRAIQAYSEALDLLIESNADALSLAQMHIKLGDAYSQRFNGDEAWQQYSHALALLQPAQPSEQAPPSVPQDLLLCLYDRLAELPTRWLDTFNNLPDFQQVRTYIEAGLQLLEREPISRSRVAFLTYQAIWYMRQIEWKIATVPERAALAEQALTSGTEALRIAEELNDTYSIWISLDALSSIYQERRMYLDAHKVQHQRLQLASLISSREETHDLYISLGYVHLFISDYSTAAKWFGRAWRIAQTMESPPMLLNSLQGRMFVWYQWNRWDEARDVARNMLQIVEQYQQDEHWSLEALDVLADLAYRVGNNEEGNKYSRQYKRLLEQRGSQLELPTSIYIAREDWTRAAEICKELLARSEPFPRPAVLANLAELVVTTGESTGIQQTICDRAVNVAEKAGARKSLAIALRARGRMYLEQQNWEAAESDLRSSLDLARELDVPLEQGQTLYYLGLFYRLRAYALHQDSSAERKADLGRAQYHLEQALGFFESLKAERMVERVRIALTQNYTAPYLHLPQ